MMWKYITKGIVYSLVFGLALLGTGAANAALVPPWPSTQMIPLPTPDRRADVINSQNQLSSPGYIVPPFPSPGVYVPLPQPSLPLRPFWRCLVPPIFGGDTDRHPTAWCLMPPIFGGDTDRHPTAW